MGDEPVGAEACHRQHARAHSAQVDPRYRGLLVRAGVEVRLQASEPVVPTLERGELAGTERSERSTKDVYVVVHPLRRRRPRHAVAVLDVLPDLCPQPQLESAPGDQRQVPCRVRGRQGTAGERQRDGGPDDEPIGRLQSQQRQQERVVHGLGDMQTVEPCILDPAGELRHGARGDGRVGTGVDLHRSCLPARADRSAPRPSSSSPPWPHPKNWNLFSTPVNSGVS